VFLSLLLTASMGCNDSGSTPAASGILTTTPDASGELSTPANTPGNTAQPSVSSTALPSVTPAQPLETQPPQTPTPVPEPLTLEVVAPADESASEVGFVRVMGTTSGTSVSINGLPVSVAEDGDFQGDLSLEDGVNLIEVVASDGTGRTASQQITVFAVAPNASLPFSIFYPPDGLEVSDPSVTLLGVTRPDAVVGVNDAPVVTDDSGIFSTQVELEEGANLIEVVAADIDGNVRFQTVGVFYIP
jgi:hypothetical protein